MPLAIFNPPGSFPTRKSAGHEPIDRMKKTKLMLATLALVVSQSSTFNASAADEVAGGHKWSVSADFGTLGAGVSLGWRFSDRFALRGGIAGFPSQNADGEEFSGITYDTAEVQLLNAPVAVDFYPLKGRTFRISAGVLINQNELEGSVSNPGTPGKTVQIGGNTYDVFNDLSGLNTTVEMDPVAPFLSIGGSIYLDAAKRWSLGGEIGLAFVASEATIAIGNATTALNAGFQTDRAQEESELEDDITIYPIVKVAVTFSF